MIFQPTYTSENLLLSKSLESNTSSSAQNAHDCESGTGDRLTYRPRNSTTNISNGRTKAEEAIINVDAHIDLDEGARSVVLSFIADTPKSRHRALIDRDGVLGAKPAIEMLTSL
jgi:hypothetical protein